MLNHLKSWEIALIIALVALPIGIFGAIEVAGRMNRRKAKQLAQRDKKRELEERRGLRDSNR